MSVRHTEIESSNPPVSTRHCVAMGWMLFLLVLLVYLPSFRCGFIWDDDDYVLENRSIQTWDGLGRIWFEPRATPQYYPLVHSMFWFEHRFWGLNPTGYHVVNVLLHCATCVLIWKVLVKLQVPGAWLAAAVFGVHPVHVESVAWITERKNVLSAFCYVAALLVVLPLIGLANNSSNTRFAFRRYLFATTLFVGALLSKSVTCSLPAVCLLLVYWKRGRVTLREGALFLPWFALGLVAALQTAWLERTHVGAVGAVFSWTPIERCWIAGHALWFYLEKLLWPHPLIFFYPRRSIEIGRASSWIAPVTAALLPVGLWFGRGWLGRGPLVATLFFGGTLVPALGFVNLYPMRYSFVADHFQYLASLGPIVLLVSCLASSVATGQTKNTWWISAGALFVLLPLCVVTWQQQAIYRDVESLWTDVLTKNPDSFAAHFHLGKVRTLQGRHEEAAGHFRESLRLQTDDSESYIALTLLGNSLARQGRFAQAEACLSDALRRHPDDWEALHGLATIAARQQRNTEAIEFFRRVLVQRPNEPVVRMNLGNALAMMGNLDDAIQEYQTALRLRPNLTDAQVNLANVFARKGRYREAEQLYVQALNHQPSHSQAVTNLAKVRAAIQREKMTAE